MTVPRSIAGATRTVADLVRNMLPQMRYRLVAEEKDLAVYLRGNKALFEALSGFIQLRIRGRANKPVPSDPQECMVSMAMDRELRQLLARLEFVYCSPTIQPANNEGEPPE